MKQMYHLLEVKEVNGELKGKIIKNLGHTNHRQAAEDLRAIYPLVVDNFAVVGDNIYNGEKIWGLGEEDFLAPSGETPDWIGKSEEGFVFIYYPREEKMFLITERADGECSYYPISLLD